MAEREDAPVRAMGRELEWRPALAGLEHRVGGADKGQPA
jgi:hypothetical protein